MFAVDLSKPILVTGATGYVASWIVKRLLEEGATVHAAVRDPDDAAKVGHLVRLAEDSPGTLRMFKADLLDKGSYAAAMEGCAIVFHTASPFKLDVKDVMSDLVNPARQGTENVLATANKVASVKRVVLTSSCAAIYGDSADIQQAPGQILTEAVWNTSSSLQHVPYSYSKTVAEQVAWKIAQAQSRWRLVVINPSLVFGPALNPFGSSESFNLMRQLGDGRMKMGMPDIGLGVVDVRDVAEAHLRAAFLPDAEGRHIVSATNTSLRGIASALLPEYEDYPVPSRILPKCMVWLLAPLADKSTTRKFVSRNVGYAWRADNSKSVRALQMSYRPLSVTVQEMFQQLVDSGQIKKPSA